MGFSDKVIFNEPSLFITVISEKRPVSKSDLIIALLAESEYSSPILMVIPSARFLWRCC